MEFTSILGNTPSISDGASISLPHLKIGWMYNPDLALLITSLGLNYSLGDYDRSIDGIIPSVQYWIKTQFVYNDPAFKRRGDYDFLEVAKLIACNQVPSNRIRIRFKTPCYRAIYNRV